MPADDDDDDDDDDDAEHAKIEVRGGCDDRSAASSVRSSGKSSGSNGPSAPAFKGGVDHTWECTIQERTREKSRQMRDITKYQNKSHAWHTRNTQKH
jgi:hypothetical protein